MNLTIESLLPLLPIILSSLTAIVVMLAIAFGRNHWWNATLTVVGLNISLAATIWLALSQPLAPQMVTPLLVVDAYAYFYMALILAGTLACCTLAHAYLDARPHFFFLNRYDASDPLHVDNRAVVERLAPTAHSVRSCLNLLIP